MGDLFAGWIEDYQLRSVVRTPMMARMKMTVEAGFVEVTKDLDPVKVARFLAKQRKDTRRLVDRANAGDKLCKHFAGWTEADIENTVQMMFRQYQHSLRIEIFRPT